MKVNHTSPSLFCVVLVWFGIRAQAEVTYPGKPPGPISVSCSDGNIQFSNQALCVKWDNDRTGLKPDFARDVQAHRTLSFTGELFEIRLTNAIFAASSLVPETTPKAKRLFAKVPPGLSTGTAGSMVELPMRSGDGRLQVTWRASAWDNVNYIRQELEISANRQDCTIQQIRFLNESMEDARTEGQVDGSPLVAGTFFMGCEDPHSRNLVSSIDSSTGANQRVSCTLEPNLLLKAGEKLSLSFVLGVTPENQLRRGFLYYLENERVHPYRTFLHYNSWYDIAWDPFALNESNCLEAIRVTGEHLVKQHGVTMDAMVFDDGWDDPQTLWQFHRGFPSGFTPLATLCKQYQTHLGVWLSPFGGYGESQRLRLKFGAAHGYETNTTGFSLAGPKYYEAFKQACVGMIRNYSVNHFKFDGIAAGMYANGGSGYYRDTQAMRRLMLELRQEDPNLYINLTTGSWPSPFWLRYADSLWRQGDDMGFTGKGSRQQQWCTYRDQEVYRNIVRKGPLFPLNSLMTQGVAYSRRGSAGDPTFNSAGFKDDVRAFFGSGTGLQELYIQPDKLTSSDWAVLAEAAKWSRVNSDVLVDTHWIGGDPSRREVYGYAAWSARKGIIMLRNPDDRSQEFTLDLANAFELPSGASTKYVLKSPWAEDSAQPSRPAESNSPLIIMLSPFAVRLYEAKVME